MMKDDDFKLLKGFALRRTDICNYGVAFATDNPKMGYHVSFQSRKRLYNRKCLSVRPSVCKTPEQLQIIILHHSSFIFHLSSFFIHPSSFIFLHSSFIILHHSSSFFIILHSSFLHFAILRLFSLFLQ